MASVNIPTTTGAYECTEMDRALCERVRGEYRELPGLRLTLAQASRLFNLEVSQCSQVLQALVECGALRTDGREFLATDMGRHCH